MTPHLTAVLNTGEPTAAPPNELLDLVMMVSDSAWAAKGYTAAKRAAKLALALDPGCEAALNRLGRIALARREYQAAGDYLCVLDKSPAALVSLAIVDGCQKHFDLALASCEQAIEMDPEFLPAHIHKAALLEEIDRLAEAERCVIEALQIFPGNSELLYALSLYQLKRGAFESGWINYEHRPPRLDLARKLDEYPEWHGERLEGKTILVCGEQGLGDQIMFARYVPLLQWLGAKVVLFTMAELARLFVRSFSGVRILASDPELNGLEPDYWIAMGSLPLRWRQFGSIDIVGTPKDSAAALPYLWPNLADMSRFATLVPNNGNLRVGLCWKGNPTHRRDEYRSMRFEDLKPLLDIPGVDFYSLQRGDTESGLLNLTGYCHDIADTAAAVAALDLVITVDTAMLHLAGAIGVPVNGIIHRPGEWRWGSEDSAVTPWYSSAVLFRQRGQLKWAGVIQDLRSALTFRARFPSPRGIEPAPEPLTVTRDCKYGPMMWLRNDHYIGRALDLYGEYSESEADLLRKVLQPGDTVVEAGANVGGLTMALGAIVGQRGTVYAYEPQPAYFDCLVFNTAMPTQIHAVQAALGREQGRVMMHAVERQKVHAPGWSTSGGNFTAPVRTIDSLGLPQCALIKVDVDGPEHEILLGAEATIDRCRPLIYVEYDKPAEYPEMIEWLHAKGYRLYRHAAPLFNPQNYRGNPVNVFGSTISLMVLAVPQERKYLHPSDWGLERIPVVSA